MSELNGVSAASWRDLVVTEFKALSVFFELPFWLSYFALAGASPYTTAMLVVSMLLRLARAWCDVNTTEPLRDGLNSMRLEVIRWVLLCGASLFVQPQGVALHYL